MMSFGFKIGGHCLPCDSGCGFRQVLFESFTVIDIECCFVFCSITP